MNLLFVQIPAHMVRGIGIAEGRGGILVPFHFGLLIHLAPTHTKMEWYQDAAAAFRYPDAPNHVGWYLNK